MLTGGPEVAERDIVIADTASPTSNPQFPSAVVPPISMAETASTSASLRMVVGSLWFPLGLFSFPL